MSHLRRGLAPLDKFPVVCRHWLARRCSYKPEHLCPYIHGHICPNDGHCSFASCSDVHLKQRHRSDEGGHLRIRRQSRSRSRSISPRQQRGRGGESFRQYHGRSPPQNRRKYVSSRSRSRSPRRRRSRSRGRRYSRSRSRSPRFRRSRSRSRPRRRIGRSRSRSSSQPRRFNRSRSPNSSRSRRRDSRSNSPPTVKSPSRTRDRSPDIFSDLSFMQRLKNIEDQALSPRHHVAPVFEKKDITLDNVKTIDINTPDSEPDCISVVDSGNDQSSDEEIKVLSANSSEKIISTEESLSELRERIARKISKPETKALLESVLKITAEERPAGANRHDSPSPDFPITDKDLEELDLGIKEVGEELDICHDVNETEVSNTSRTKAANPSPPRVAGSSSIPQRQSNNLPYHSDWELKLALENPGKPLEREMKVPFKPPAVDKSRGSKNSSVLWTPALDRRQVLEAKQQQFSYPACKSNWEVETPYIERNIKKFAFEEKKNFPPIGKSKSSPIQEQYEVSGSMQELKAKQQQPFIHPLTQSKVNREATIFSRPVQKQQKEDQYVDNRTTAEPSVDSQQKEVGTDFQDHFEKKVLEIIAKVSSKASGSIFSAPSLSERSKSQNYDRSPSVESAPLSERSKSHHKYDRSPHTESGPLPERSKSHHKYDISPPTESAPLSERSKSRHKYDRSPLTESAPLSEWSKSRHRYDRSPPTESSTVSGNSKGVTDPELDKMKSFKEMEELMEMKSQLQKEVISLEGNRDLLIEHENNLKISHKDDREGLYGLLKDNSILLDEVRCQISRKRDKLQDVNINLMKVMKRSGFGERSCSSPPDEKSHKLSSSSSESDHRHSQDMVSYNHPQEYGRAQDRIHPRKHSPSYRSHQSLQNSSKYGKSRKRSASPEGSVKQILPPETLEKVSPAKLKENHWAKSVIVGTLKKFKKDLFAEVDVDPSDLLPKESTLAPVNKVLRRNTSSPNDNIRGDDPTFGMHSSTRLEKGTSHAIKKGRWDSKYSVGSSKVSGVHSSMQEDYSMHSSKKIEKETSHMTRKGRWDSKVSDAHGSVHEDADDKSILPSKLLHEDDTSVKALKGKSEEEVYYRYMDLGNHWCSMCDLIFETLPMYCNHLWSSSHLSKLKNDKMPWLAKVTKDEKEVIPSGVKVLASPILGSEFLHSLPVVYCSLCDVFLRDKGEALNHPESKAHARNYREYVKTNKEGKVSSYQKSHRAAISRHRLSQGKKSGKSNMEEMSQIEGKLLRAVKSNRDKSKDKKEDKIERETKEEAQGSVRVAYRGNSRDRKQEDPEEEMQGKGQGSVRVASREQKSQSSSLHEKMYQRDRVTEQSKVSYYTSVWEPNKEDTYTSWKSNKEVTSTGLKSNKEETSTGLKSNKEETSTGLKSNKEETSTGLKSNKEETSTGLKSNKEETSTGNGDKTKKENFELREIENRTDKADRLDSRDIFELKKTESIKAGSEKLDKKEKEYLPSIKFPLIGKMPSLKKKKSTILKTVPEKPNVNLTTSNASDSGVSHDESSSADNTSRNSDASLCYDKKMSLKELKEVDDKELNNSIKSDKSDNNENISSGNAVLTVEKSVSNIDSELVMDTEVIQRKVVKEESACSNPPEISIDCSKDGNEIRSTSVVEDAIIFLPFRDADKNIDNETTKVTGQPHARDDDKSVSLYMDSEIEKESSVNSEEVPMDIDEEDSDKNDTEDISAATIRAIDLLSIPLPGFNNPVKSQSPHAVKSPSPHAVKSPSPRDPVDDQNGVDIPQEEEFLKDKNLELEMINLPDDHLSKEIISTASDVILDSYDQRAQVVVPHCNRVITPPPPGTESVVISNSLHFGETKTTTCALPSESTSLLKTSPPLPDTNSNVSGAVHFGEAPPSETDSNVASSSLHLGEAITTTYASPPQSLSLLRTESLHRATSPPPRTEFLLGATSPPRTKFLRIATPPPPGTESPPPIIDLNESVTKGDLEVEDIERSPNYMNTDKQESVKSDICSQKAFSDLRNIPLLMETHQDRLKVTEDMISESGDVLQENSKTVLSDSPDKASVDVSPNKASVDVSPNKASVDFSRDKASVDVSPDKASVDVLPNKASLNVEDNDVQQNQSMKEIHDKTLETETSCIVQENAEIVESNLPDKDEKINEIDTDNENHEILESDLCSTTEEMMVDCVPTASHLIEGDLPDSVVELKGKDVPENNEEIEKDSWGKTNEFKDLELKDTLKHSVVVAVDEMAADNSFSPRIFPDGDHSDGHLREAESSHESLLDTLVTKAEEIKGPHQEEALDEDSCVSLLTEPEPQEESRPEDSGENLVKAFSVVPGDEGGEMTKVGIQQDVEIMDSDLFNKAGEIVSDFQCKDAELGDTDNLDGRLSEVSAKVDESVLDSLLTETEQINESQEEAFGKNPSVSLLTESENQKESQGEVSVENLIKECFVVPQDEGEKLEKENVIQQNVEMMDSDLFSKAGEIASDFECKDTEIVDTDNLVGRLSEAESSCEVSANVNESVFDSLFTEVEHIKESQEETLDKNPSVSLLTEPENQKQSQEPALDKNLVKDCFVVFHDEVGKLAEEDDHQMGPQPFDECPLSSSESSPMKQESFTSSEDECIEEVSLRTNIRVKECCVVLEDIHKKNKKL